MFASNQLHLRLTVDVIYDLDPEETGIQADKEKLKERLLDLADCPYLNGNYTEDLAASLFCPPDLTVEEIISYNKDPLSHRQDN